MTSSSPFSSISCGGSWASHYSLLISKLWSVKLLHLENQTAKVAEKSAVTEVCCWTTDTWLQTPRKPPVSSSGSSSQRTSSAKVRCSGCKRLHVSSTCLIFRVICFQVTFSVSVDSDRHRHGSSPWRCCWPSTVESVALCKESWRNLLLLLIELRM